MRFVAYRVRMVAYLLFVALFASSAAADVPLQSIRNRLEQPDGRPITLVFFGDSHIGAFGVDNPHGAISFLAQQLAAYYPNYRINLINRRIGSGNRQTSDVADCLPATTTSTPDDVTTTATYNANAPYTLNIVRDGAVGNNVFRFLARISAQPFPSGEAPFAGLSPDAVVVMLGVNDSLYDGTQTEDANLNCYPSNFTPDNLGRAVDLRVHGESTADYAAGLGAIVDKLRSVAPGVVLATPMWVPGLQRFQAGDTQANFANYAGQVGAVAAAKGVPVIDVFNWMNVDPTTNFTSDEARCAPGLALDRGSSTDCVHLSSIGNFRLGVAMLSLGFGLRDYRNGWWYDPYRPGTGFFYESQKGYAFLRIFLYDDDDNGQSIAISTMPGVPMSDGYVFNGVPVGAWTNQNGAPAFAATGSMNMIFGDGPADDWRQTAGPNAADSPDANGDGMRMGAMALYPSSGGVSTHALMRYSIDGGWPHPPPIESGIPAPGWWHSCSQPVDFAFEASATSHVYMGYTAFDPAGELRWFVLIASQGGGANWAGPVEEYGGGQTFSGAYAAPQLIAVQGTGFLAMPTPNPAPGDCSSGGAASIPNSALGGNFQMSRLRLYPN